MKLTDQELTLKLKSLCTEERTLTRVILEHIAEIDKRKFFLGMGYRSLFEYLVEEIGYSEGSAQRRIDAVRAMRLIPEIGNRIETGSLHLVQVSKVQKICREVEKEERTKIGVAKRKEVLKKIAGLGAKETDLVLAKEFGRKIETAETQKIQRDESVRVELTFTKEEMELLKRAQALLSKGNLKETVLALAEKSTTATVAVSRRVKPETKKATPRLRKEILSRDGYRCQFRDPKSGRQCNATQYLQLDHVKPRFAGGATTPDNLRAYCPNHNVFRYEKGLG